MTNLALILLDDYLPEELLRGFRAAFDELGLSAAFKPGEKILVKPNLLTGVAPDKAVSPHPQVFRALVRCLQEYQLDLSYGDSPSMEPTEKAARGSGLAGVAEELGLPLANFSETVEIPLPAGKVLRQLPLARGVADADGLVSLAKLKTHALTGMTGALKNQFGVIPGQRKAAYHANFPALEDFSQMLVDINQYLQPRLYVMDAIVAMEGNGPRNGHPRKVGAVLISRDPVAVDAAGAFLIGMDPQAIVTSRLAAQAGLGCLDLAAIDTCLIRPTETGIERQTGKASHLLKDLQVKDFVSENRFHTIFAKATSIGAPLLKRFVMRRPVIIDSRCVRCGICVKACPAAPKVLSQKAAGCRPVFAYERCIRCYCCQEACPAGAIEVRRTLIGRLLRR